MNGIVMKNLLQKISSPVLVLIGPTAIGKTDLSLNLAERFNCEIISVDSMQVYRYMDIGTAKPSIQERRGIPHHLIDIIDPDARYDASLFRVDALQAIMDITKRGKIPLLTGGTGLYLKALTDGLFSVSVKENLDLRENLKKRLDLEGKERLYAELKKIDILTAARIHKNDTHRLLRALEIFYSTGRTWSSYLQEQNESPVQFEKIFKAGLHCKRQDLYDRIEKRSLQMLEGGLIQEVEKLHDMGYDKTLASMQSIGYRHVNNYLSGLWNMDETTRLLVRDTRRYAKRQLTWFGKDSSLTWFARQDHERIYFSIEKWLAGDPTSSTNNLQ